MHEIDFLPERITAQRRLWGQRKRWLALLACAVAAMVSWGLAGERRIRAAQAERTAQQRQRDNLQMHLALIPSLNEQKAAGLIKQRISDELGSRLPVNAVLAEVASCLPPSAALIHLEFSTVKTLSGSETGRPRNRAVGTEKPRSRVKLLLTGIAPDDVDVANFIGKLSACPIFTDVNMHYTRTLKIDHHRRRARGFQLSCLLVE